MKPERRTAAPTQPKPRGPQAARRSADAARDQRPGTLRLNFGHATEARFLMDAQLHGLLVSKPFSNNPGYDFLVDTQRGIVRVQVKGAHSQMIDSRATYIFNFCQRRGRKQVFAPNFHIAACTTPSGHSSTCTNAHPVSLLPKIPYTTVPAPTGANPSTTGPSSTAPWIPREVTNAHCFRKAHPHCRARTPASRDRKSREAVQISKKRRPLLVDPPRAARKKTSMPNEPYDVRINRAIALIDRGEAKRVMSELLGSKKGHV